MLDLRERHVLVTGAGSGIGRAVALRLSAAGARLTLLGRRLAELEKTAAEARGETLCLSADVADRKGVEAAFAGAAAQLGALHALVANAGTGGPNPDAAGDDPWELILRTNLDGAYFCLRAFEAHLAPGPEPRHAVVVSSCVARFGVPGISAYSAAKAGQLGLVRSLAAELGPRGVRVNAICPGWVDTHMAEERMSEIARESGADLERTRRELLAALPLPRMSSPEEIAGVVEFLLSPAADAFTGQALDPNNGAWMG